ncbi:MAG: peptidylprolyl isomerase [Candidatus Micropelagos thuwalensis]
MTDMENPPAENLPYMPFLLGLVALAGLIVAVSTVFDTPKPDYEGTAVAFVNEVPIPETGYLRALSMLEQDKRGPITDADRIRILDLLIEEELLIQRADEINLIGIDSSVRKSLTSAMIQFIISENGDTEITDDILNSHFLNNLDYFTPSKQIWVKRIYVRGARDDAEQRLQQIRTALQQGENFDTVATQLGDEIFPEIPNSLLPPSKLQAYLGPALTQTAISLDEGAITNAIRVGSGWHFLYLVQQRKGVVPELDDIQDQVENDYLRKVEEKALRDYLDWLRERADIDQTASQLQPADF